MHSSALMVKSSALCCRHFAGEFINNGANDPGAAASTDSWDSAMSNSPEDFGGCGGFGGVSSWWNNGGIDSFGGGGRFAEVSGLNDEGYLEGVARMSKLDFYEETEEEADCDDDKDDDDDDDDEDDLASNGSEILQMVDQLLLAFNLEVAAANAAETAAAADASDVFDMQTASNLANGFCQLDAADEIPDANDDSDLPTDDEEAFWMAEHDLQILDFDNISLGGEDADNEASSRSSTSASSAVTTATQQATHAPAFLATGVFRMPQEAVLESMDYWGPLDRIRWLLWRPEPCPPMPQNPQQQQQQPLDKSKRACSFLLKGRCRKEDCEFAHDLSRVTCKFWAAGQCFKGRGCPFLHGYAD